MIDLPITNLRTFVAIVENGGFSQAANALGSTQPTVSQQLKKLEDMLSLQLIKRGQRRLELTGDGESLLDLARRILSLNDEAVASLTMPLVEGKLRLGLPHEFTHFVLPNIVGAFSQSHPGIVVDVSCELSKNLLADQSEFDVILALHERDSDKGGTRLRSEPLVWVAGRDFEFVAGNRLPVIAAPTPCIYRSNLTRALAGYKAGWDLRLTSASYTAVCAAVAAGMGITVLAESVVAENLKIIRESELGRLEPVELRLHYHQSDQSEAIRTFTSFVKRRLKGT